MTTDQARALCVAFEKNPDEACGSEPRAIAIQRIFDSEGADTALMEHIDRANAAKPAPVTAGRRAKTLAATTGGAA